MSSASPSKRRARVVAAGCAIACAISFASVPANAVPNPISASPTDAGLFGSADPTYTGVYRQSLSLLALQAAGVTPPSVAVNWLLSQQCADGGFQGYTTSASACAAPDSTNYAGEDSNTTGLALEALSSLGEQLAAQKAADWLVAHQNTDLGFAYYPDQATNANPPASDANSTAIALIGLNAFNAYVTSLPTPGFAYANQADNATTFLKSLQLVPCPIAPAKWPANATDGSFTYTATAPGNGSNNYSTVQASFALSGQLLTDGPFAAGTVNEIPITCTGITPDAYDPAKISAGYINNWVGSATTPFNDGQTDEPGWAALSMIAGGLALPLVGDQPSLDIALTAEYATVGPKTTDPGLIAMDVLTRHAQPGGATDSAITPLINRLKATLAPVNSIAPKVTGIAKVGQTVTCNGGTWKKSPTGYTYAWYNGASTPVSRQQTLTLSPTQLGKSMRCTVTATNAFGTSTATSATVKVGVGTLANTELPTIVGTARVGRTLAAISGKWNLTPTSAKYVWKRGTTVVGTGITYTVKKADRGKRLTVVVTASHAVDGRTAYVGTATSKSRTVR